MVAPAGLHIVQSHVSSLAWANSDSAVTHDVRLRLFDRLDSKPRAKVSIQITNRFYLRCSYFVYRWLKSYLVDYLPIG